jgi:hypothetical protein
MNLPDPWPLGIVSANNGRCHLKQGLMMVTQYDKAIAAFLTSLAGLGAAFGLSKYLTWLNQDTILAITPFVTMIVTWLVPNKPA